ncbi:MAG: Membrane protein involved in colicin uptake [Candidatus Saccharibacteria bacterium]|nr:Membrane protein involved in colicin uptake [Candidatus Saccharibacteria bacterium]
MAEQIEETRTVARPVDSEPIEQQEVRATRTTKVTGSTLAARIIWYIAGVILVLLAFRFILTLLGANQNNGFADFIYGVSHPFVAPFFGLFGYNLQYGVSRFETYTLVAMLVYAIVAWGLARLATINQSRGV